MTRTEALTLALIPAVAIIAVACRGAGASPTTAPTDTGLTARPSAADAGTTPAATSGAPTSSPIATASAPDSTPALSATTGALPTAPDSARVDLVRPTFADPTTITNPRFPMSELRQVIQLGTEAGARLRFEITLLPDTKAIEWDGQSVETVVSQFVAYQDGRLLEVARDFFAQADDGAVWYFGEDVFNYKRGVIDNTDGTWLAGRDGPPGMIMPADPQVGDVYRPENIPGLVFEEVTVLATDQTVDGPRGPVEGAIVIQELLMDGVIEGKTFAPGYGEFQAVVESEGELVDLALAVPTDALAEPAPAELTMMTGAMADIFEAIGSAPWADVSATAVSATGSWRAYRPSGVPPILEAQMDAALDALAAAIDGRDAARACQAALDVAHASLDVQLRYRPSAEVDLERMDLWARQVLVDTTAADAAAVRGDAATLETFGDRIGHTLAGGLASAIDGHVADLRAAADVGDLPAARDAALSLRATLAGQ